MRKSRRIPVGSTLEPEMLAFANVVSRLGAERIDVKPGSRSDIINDALRMMAEAVGVSIEPGMTEEDFTEQLGA